MHWRSLACLAALVSPLEPALAQGLSPVESKLVEAVKSRTNEQVAALEKVVNVDGLGAKGDGFHGPDESIDLNSLGPATSRAAVLIYRATHQRRP